LPESHDPRAELIALVTLPTPPVINYRASRGQKGGGHISPSAVRRQIGLLLVPT